MKKELIFGALLALSGFASAQQWSPSSGNLFNNPTTSNIGIGTSSPQFKLHVQDPNNAQLFIFTAGPNPARLSLANSYLQYYFSTDLGIGHLGLTAGTPNGNIDHPLINFRTDNSLQPNVWIGDATGAPNLALLNLNASSTNAYVLDIYNPVATSPANKLVFRIRNNGAVYAQQVTVQLANYPDYVFKRDYKLMSLEDLGAYVQHNHHLPNVPTAEEIEKEGANLGELNKLQMEKIEELTLYVLELKKEIEAIKKNK